MSAPTLFDPIVAHCVFCRHVAESYDADPVALHEAMEGHYTSAHQAQIRKALGLALVRTVVIGAEWDGEP